jgi:SPP1 gp7 family putative phage head morphogenesis protein
MPVVTMQAIQAMAVAELPVRFNIRMSPAQTADAFRAKGLLPPEAGFSWQDVEREENAFAFTVAKATSYDVLNTIRDELYRAMADGMTPQTFIRRLKPRLIELGWWGRQRLTDPLTGEEKNVQLGSPARLRTIFDTNMRTARAVGKWQRIQERKLDAPYLQYGAVLDGRTRPLHRQWGTRPVILPVDHPWWQTHFPPNGWFCRCTVTQLTATALRRSGLSVTDPPPQDVRLTNLNRRTGEIRQVPVGIDPGFDYNPGVHGRAALEARPVDSPKQVFIPARLAENVVTDAMPAPQVLRADYLFEALPSRTGRPLPPRSSLDESQAAEKLLDDLSASRTFLAQFTTTGQSVVFTDVAGEPLVIGDRFFRRADGSFKFFDINQRRSHVIMLAEAIKSPSEIWELSERDESTGQTRLMRRYLARFTVAGTTDIVDGFVLFEYDPASRRSTAFAPATGPNSDYLSKQRRGRRVYVRP